MTTSLQRHLLLKLSKAQTLGEKGFTLIELLVVIIIIGILAAVALPSLLAQTDKARASEAKSTMGAISRAQQAYYLENSAFTTSLSNLGIASTTQNFTYSSAGTGPATITAAGASNGITCTMTLNPPVDSAHGFTTSSVTCLKGSNYL